MAETQEQIQERIKIVCNIWSDEAAAEVANLPESQQKFFTRRLPNAKPKLEPVGEDAVNWLRHQIKEEACNDFFGKEARVYYDRHPGGYRSMTVISNSVRESAKFCEMVTREDGSRFFACYIIPYVERPHSDRPYFWVRLKVLFNPIERRKTC